ncbi:MAG: dCTP deaminase [Elusimicrobia bacterium]|nr:dCTP deaminase [Elusimicrobiota bacterium]
MKSDKWIKKMAAGQKMIEPFEGKQVKNGLISYGLSSYGYDARLADEFRIWTSTGNVVIDPKNFAADSLAEFKGNCCTIPPNSFALGRSLEYFRIPRKVLALCFGKSTYARCGILVNITPLEPEWEGYITIEISNTTPFPAKVYANEGIAQIIFFESDEECMVSYADRKGKYQKQTKITPPKITGTSPVR